MNDMNFYELILGASTFVQLIMLILLGMSLASWAVIFSKLSTFSKLKLALNKFEKEFTEDFDKLIDLLSRQRENSLGVTRLLRAGVREYLQLADNKHADPKLSIATCERAMQVVFNQEYQRLSHGLSLLATVGSIAVYVGLLGTVWGVMSAFNSMGSTANITLAMVAPGIAEALIATAIGLIAAIPAAYAHNRFRARLTEISGIYNSYAEAFLAMSARRLMEKR